MEREHEGRTRLRAYTLEPRARARTHAHLVLHGDVVLLDGEQRGLHVPRGRVRGAAQLHLALRLLQQRAESPAQRVGAHGSHDGGQQDYSKLLDEVNKLCCYPC